MFKFQTEHMSSQNKSRPIGIIAIILIAIVPLITNKELNEYFLVPRTVHWSVVSVIALIGAILLKGPKSVKMPWPLALWTVFTLFCFAGMGNALSSGEWWLTFSRYGLYLSATIAAIHLFRENKLNFDDVAKGLVLFGLIGSIIALSDLSRANDVYDVFKPFGHKNFTSAALLVSLLASLRIVQSKQKPWSYLGIAAIVLSTIVIILLRTRGVWIASIMASIVLLLGTRVFRPADLKTSVVPVKYIGIGFAVLVIGIIAVISQPKVEEAIFDSANVDFRLTYWDHSIQMFEEEPITGVGAGQWKFHFPKYGLENTNTRVSNGETAVVRPHNDYLWILSENGIMGLLLYVGFWGWTILIGVQRLRVTEGTDQRMRLISALSILTAFLTYALGEFPIERVDIAIPVFLAAGFILSEAKGFKIGTKLFLGLGLIFALNSAYRAFTRMSNEVHVHNINEGNDRQDILQITTAFEKVDLDVVNADLYANPLPYFQGLATMASASNRQGQFDPNRMQEARAYFDDALKIHPYHVATYNQYGNWFKYQDRLDEAMEMYQKGLDISPYNTELRLNHAEVLLRQKNADGAALLLYNLKIDDGNGKYNSLVVESLRKLRTGSKHDVINDFLNQVDVRSIPDNQLVLSFNRYKNTRS